MPTAFPSSRSGAYESGLSLAAEGRHAEAISCFETALTLSPDDTRILFALGNTARAIGQSAAAENFYTRVLTLAPDRVEALVNLANLLCANNRAQDAIALLSPALARAPDSAELWLTAGLASQAMRDNERAAIFYNEALRLRPDYAAALGNLADLLSDDGQTEPALKLYDRVIRSEPHNAQARLNRAILYFLSGDLARGWRDYEYRLKLGYAVVHTHGLSRWNGKSVPKGKRLLVTAEQGVGDQIMFASLIPELAARMAERGCTVVLETEPRLVPLLARSFPGVAVRPSRIEQKGGIKTAYYDGSNATAEAVPLGSLALHLRRDGTDFPAPHAYLRVDTAAQDSWRTWLAQHGPGPFTGLCWRSGNLMGMRTLQYAPLEVWADFARAAPGNLVSLQYDASGEEITRLEQLSGRRILQPPALDQKNEIDRTTAMIACLDHVVSAPTAVAWMAAAVGVPTFKILYNNVWTTFGANYEPFAPAARAIMPKTRGDWADCFTQVLAAFRPGSV